MRYSNKNQTEETQSSSFSAAYSFKLSSHQKSNSSGEDLYPISLSNINNINYHHNLNTNQHNFLHKQDQPYTYYRQNKLEICTNTQQLLQKQSFQKKILEKYIRSGVIKKYYKPIHKYKNSEYQNYNLQISHRSIDFHPLLIIQQIAQPQYFSNYRKFKNKRMFKENNPLHIKNGNNVQFLNLSLKR